MCYSESSCTIQRVANGYIIRAKDPKIVAANNKRTGDDKPHTSYRDPEVQVVCKNSTEVKAFLDKHLDAMLPEQDFVSAFATALTDKSS